MGFFSFSSFAQNSAQATMRVSATVVSGSSVDIEKPELVLLSKNEESELGVINFKGIEKGNVYISNANQIVLTDKNGNQIEMDINSSRKYEEDSNRIEFQGESNSKLMSSVYQGELTTSIEYF